MKKALSLLLALLLCLGLAECGSKSAMTEEISNDSAPAQASRAMNTGGSLGLADPSGEALPEDAPQKIIYSGDARVETTDFDASVEALLKMVSDCGGWVEQSSLNGSSFASLAQGQQQERYAHYALRIPSDGFHELMDSLSVLGNVPYTNIYSENISSRYYDTEARMKVYQAQEQRLLELLEEARTVSDVIAVEEQLSELRYQIESLQTSLKNWDKEISYSLLELDLEEVREYGPEAGDSYAQRLWKAFTGAFRNMGEFFRDLLVFLVSAIPTLLISVLAVLLIPLWRRLHRRRKSKKDTDTKS